MEFERLKEVWDKREVESQVEDRLKRQTSADPRKSLRKSRIKDALGHVGVAAAEVALIAGMVFWLWIEPDTWARAGVIIMMAALVMVLPLLEMIRIRLRPKTKDKTIIDHVRMERDLLRAQISLERWYSWLYILPMTCGLTIYAVSAELSVAALIGFILLILGLGGLCYFRDRRKLRRELMPIKAEFEQNLFDLLMNGDRRAELKPKQRRYFKQTIVFSLISVGFAICFGLADLFGLIQFQGVTIGAGYLLLISVPFFVFYYLKSKARFKPLPSLLTILAVGILFIPYLFFIVQPYHATVASPGQGILEVVLGFIWAYAIAGIYISINYFRGRMP